MDPTTAETAAVAPAKPKKVTLRLQPIGNAPVLKNLKIAVNPSDTLASFTKILRKLLGLKQNESLFLYIDQTFAPSLDSTFEILARCYAIKATGNDVVELQYSITPAYG